MAQQERLEMMMKTLTVGYQTPGYVQGMNRFINQNRPYFNRAMYVPEMLKDPRVSFGFRLIKGPILSKAKFIVEASDQAVKDFVIRQIERFWTRGATTSLLCLAYGWNGSEVIYRYNRQLGMVEFDKLKAFFPLDVKPLVNEYTDKITHMSVARIRDKGIIYLPAPKFFWAVNNQDHNRYYGQSIFEGAFIPWWEEWMPRGYRSIRQLWFYRNAFTSCTIKVPQGSTRVGDQVIPNFTLANEMADRYITGAAAVLPKTPGGEDNDWELEPGKGSPVPDGLLEYGEILGDDKWEGIGIPPEVVSAEGTGAFAGRRVPQQAFYSVEQEIVNEHYFDAEEQIIRPLVELGFGEQADFEVKPISLLDTMQQEEMGLVTGKIEDRGSNSYNRNEKQISENQEGNEEGDDNVNVPQ